MVDRRPRTICVARWLALLFLTPDGALCRPLIPEPPLRRLPTARVRTPPAADTPTPSAASSFYQPRRLSARSKPVLPPDRGILADTPLRITGFSSTTRSPH